MKINKKLKRMQQMKLKSRNKQLNRNRLKNKMTAELLLSSSHKLLNLKNNKKSITEKKS